jgi:hypothetical protein
MAADGQFSIVALCLGAYSVKLIYTTRKSIQRRVLCDSCSAKERPNFRSAGAVHIEAQDVMDNLAHFTFSAKPQKISLASPPGGLVFCSRFSRCGSAIWLPRRHRSLWTFCESSNHDHLTESSFVPHVLSVSTTESKRAPHIGFSNIPDFLERYNCTFISLPTLLQRVSNHGNKYWFLIDMFLTSQLHAHTHLFTYISTLYRHFLVSSTYANATSEDLSLRPSRTTPGIELTMAWAPTSHR